MANHSSVLAWRIPWTEKLGGLQSTGLQRVRQNWSDFASMHSLYLEAQECPPRRQEAELTQRLKEDSKAQNHPEQQREEKGRELRHWCLLLVVHTKVVGVAVGAESCWESGAAPTMRGLKREPESAGLGCLEAESWLGWLLEALPCWELFILWFFMHGKAIWQQLTLGSVSRVLLPSNTACCKSRVSLGSLTTGLREDFRNRGRVNLV